MDSHKSSKKKYHKIPSTPAPFSLSERDADKKKKKKRDSVPMGTTGQPKFKIIFLGNQSVGKTSIISRFAYDKYDANYRQTIGVDFLSKEVKVDKDEDRYIRLQLWDSAGQEKFWSLTSSYAKDCDVAVIMYDVTSQQSFDATTRWANEVKKEAQKYREREVLLVLAGNKTDLEDERVVSTQEGEVRAKEVGATFFEVSATSFESVRRMFDYIQGYLVPSKDKVPITARAGAAGKTFQPEDFEIDISRDPDDINSVPPARAVMPSQAIFDENYDGNDDLGGYGKKKKKKKGGLSCCPC